MKTETVAEPRPGAPPGRAPATPVMGMREWGLIALLSVIWGGSFFFIEIAVRDITPFTLVACRVSCAALLLLAAVHATGRRMPASPKMWAAFLVMGALNNALPFSLISWAQQTIDSSLASVLNATTPIFGVVLAHFLTGNEKMTGNRLFGVLAGWAGVAVLMGAGSADFAFGHAAGQFAVLGAACAYAVAAIFARRFAGMPPIVVAAGMLCGSAVIMVPSALVFESPMALSPGYPAILALGALALVSTALAYILYFRVIAAVGATNLLLVTFLIPVSATFLGVAVLGERPGWNFFAGMFCIFAGLAAVDGRVLSRLKRKRPQQAARPSAG